MPEGNESITHKHLEVSAFNGSGQKFPFCDFRLEHPDGHWYRGRWDESKSALDIDLFPAGTTRRPAKNFPGHHTAQPDPNVRTFDVELQRDGVKIFSASMTFILTRRISFMGSSAPFSATLSKQQLRRRSVWRRVLSYLRTLSLRITGHIVKNHWSRSSN